MIKTVSRFDHSISTLEAKDCMFRINRDVRFSKDKRPYKNNMGAYFNKHGKKGIGAGYYVHIEPGKCFAAAGIWMPSGEELSKIRQEIDYNFDDWKKILSNKDFKKCFNGDIDKNESLVRPPKGYSEDNPAIEYIKLKSFIAVCSLSDKEVTHKDFVKNLSKKFEVAKPLVGFINQSLD
jgi:uncharacterized protein (TIGR02453 family)